MAEDRRNRDPLAIGIAAVGAAIQIGAWFYWSGKMETRLDAAERRIEANEQRGVGFAKDNSAQDVTIAVITTQLASIKSTVDRIDKRLEQQQ